MKEFNIDHLHFLCGDGKDAWAVDITLTAIEDYSKNVLGVIPKTNVEKNYVRDIIMSKIGALVTNNKWRKENDLKPL